MVSMSFGWVETGGRNARRQPWRRRRAVRRRARGQVREIRGGRARPGACDGAEPRARRSATKMPMSEAMARPRSPSAWKSPQYMGAESTVIRVPVITGVLVSLAA